MAGMVIQTPPMEWGTCGCAGPATFPCAFRVPLLQAASETSTCPVADTGAAPTPSSPPTTLTDTSNFRIIAPLWVVARVKPRRIRPRRAHFLRYGPELPSATAAASNLAPAMCAEQGWPLDERLSSPSSPFPLMPPIRMVPAPAFTAVVAPPFLRWSVELSRSDGHRS